MAESLRALIVILGLTIPMYWFIARPTLGLAFDRAVFRRRATAWLLMVVIAFLAHNFWVFIAAAAAVILWAKRGETNPVALFFFLLFAIPPFGKQLPGFGSVTVVFAVDALRMLSVLILLPQAAKLFKDPSSLRPGKSFVDWLLLLYILLQAVLYYQYTSFPYLLRYTVLYAFVDIILPYYVISRSVRTLSQFREVMTAFVIAVLVLAPIAVFEMGKGWLLYSTLPSSLGVVWGLGQYLARDGSIRAVATAGHSIVLGYVMCMGLALYASLRPLRGNRRGWLLGLAILIAGLLAPLSRGPWVGAAVCLAVILATGPNAIQRTTRLAVVVAGLFGLLMLTPYAEKVINLIPFVGEVDLANVTYRQRLFEVSLRVIAVNPWFGTPDFLSNPAMEEMRQGEGIIDLVNSFLSVTLASGYVGLALYAGLFIASAVGVLRAMISLRDRTSELHQLGCACLAAIVGTMVVLSTASSISFIPWIYWSILGLGVAYVRLISQTRLHPTAATAATMARPVLRTPAMRPVLRRDG